MEFDKLKMYFGEPLDINDPDGHTISVLHPTIWDIIVIGEEKFYQTLNIFIANTTMYRATLWDSGIDWNDISDFDLFILLYRMIDKDISDLLFEYIDFSKFQVNQTTGETPEIVLRDPESGIVINKDGYMVMHRYLQEVFNLKPEDEYTKDAMLKKWWGENDKRETERKATKKVDKQFSIQPLISSMVNHPGFKHSLKDLKSVGVCEFYDSIQRLQVYESSTALLKGMYSGMIDGSKIKAEEYNWMKQL